MFKCHAGHITAAHQKPTMVVLVARRVVNHHTVETQRGPRVGTTAGVEVVKEAPFCDEHLNAAPDKPEIVGEPVIREHVVHDNPTRE